MPSSAASIGRLARRALPKRGIERGRLGQRNREDGAVPVDDVEAEQQGNAEAGLFHRHSLNGPHRLAPPRD